jgi:hypothetical protein
MIKYAFLKELRSKFMTHLIILFLIYLSISFFDEKAILLAQNYPTFIKQFFILIGSLGNPSFIFL